MKSLNQAQNNRIVLFSYELAKLDVEVKDMSEVALAMIRYYANDVKRINHFLKVYNFAKIIGEAENLDEITQTILEITAYTHDIGIRNSELKYQSSRGIYQQMEGPSEAFKLLNECGIDKDVIDRVCYIIAHHHEYDAVNGLDYQILKEADFLVNAFGDEITLEGIQSFKEKVFKTKTGLGLLKSIYGA